MHQLPGVELEERGHGLVLLHVFVVLAVVPELRPTDAISHRERPWSAILVREAPNRIYDIDSRNPGSIERPQTTDPRVA
jgi:hypothetical protein